MIVFGHSWGLIVLGGISVSPAGGRTVLALVLDGLPPLFKSNFVFPQVLRWPLVIGEVLEPVQDREGLLDGDLEVPRDLGYAICSFGVEESEVSGLTGSSDESDPAAALGQFFASADSAMKGVSASLIVSRTFSC